MRHLLVTNDFPPKVGGIQNYLWDLWSRLPSESYVVLTASSDPAASAFDAAQSERGVRIERVPSSILFFPTPAARAAVERCARRHEVDFVLFDPVLPLGLLGPRLSLPYGVVVHGAEVAVPGRLPGARSALAHVLRGARLVVSAGRYPAAEALRAVPGCSVPVVEIPPGVDTASIVPLAAAQRCEARARLALPTSGPLVVSISRLVPRKGMDVLIEAAGRLAPSYPDLMVAIAGEGREIGRLRRAAARSPVDIRILGRVSTAERAELLGCADVFAMVCRTRWAGLEQEGFGIVFVEAAAAGVPQIAGDSGGAPDAVADGVTGLVVDDPANPGAVAQALRALLADPVSRPRMGQASRSRAVDLFDNDLLASRLAHALAGVAI
jgi:phosphatidylinositol alpha-1,6-mannosyltransferase